MSWFSNYFGYANTLLPTLGAIMADNWKYSDYRVNNVTYQIKGGASHNIPTALYKPRLKRETAPSYGKYLRRCGVWDLPAIYVVWNPTPSDYITGPDGAIWQICVDGVTEPKLGGCWRCDVDQLIFNALIDDTVSLVQATCTGSSYTGARTVTDTIDSIFENIPCAIEPRDVDVGEHFGTISTPEYYDIYLDSDPTPDGAPSIIKAGDMLKDQNGVMYEIEEVIMRERLDLKPQFKCIKKL